MQNNAIDFHVHVFPEHLAERAVASLAAAAGVSACGAGTISDLLETMDRAGVKQSILATIATRPAQSKTINDWLLKHQSERLIPFAAIHPDDPERFNELKRVKSQGFRGVKMHPNYQDFYPDEKRVIELARAICDAGMILLLHGGADDAFEEVMSSPERIAALKESIPDLNLVVAHFGGYKCWQDVEKYLTGSDIYFDVSYTLPYLSDEDFLRIACKHGMDKVVFGTDYPWKDAAEEIGRLKKSGLTDSELSAILHENAERLLKS